MTGPAWLCNPENELLHTPVGDESLPWKDTFYFSLFDESRGAHLAMHMTVSANRAPDTRVAVGVRHGGRDRVVVRREDGRHDSSSIGNSMAWIEIVNLSWGPDHTLRWRCEAEEFSFDIVLTGVQFAPHFDTLFPGIYPTGKQGHSYSHVEQLIRGAGTLRWNDGTETVIDGFGWRDRGWGRRKSELTFGSGYDIVGGILPDGSSFAFSAMRNVEHGPDAPMPVYAFLAGDGTVRPAVGGLYHKDSMSFPAEIDLEFAGGRRVTATQVRRTSTLGVPWHDAEPRASAIAPNGRDNYAVMAGADGVEFGVFSNEGQVVHVDVTRDSRFFYDPAFAGSA